MLPTMAALNMSSQNFPEVKMFTQSTNLGFAGGTNAGIRQAAGEFILTLNNDTIVTPDFIDELAKPMVSDPSGGDVCLQNDFSRWQDQLNRDLYLTERGSMGPGHG